MTSLWQKLSRLWKNRKPIQVPLPGALRPVTQFAGSARSGSTDGALAVEDMDADEGREPISAEQATKPIRSGKIRAGDRNLAPLDGDDDPHGLEAQMRALRQEVAGLASTLSAEQADRHGQIAGALKDLAGHASAHNQSMVQVHEDLQLMTQTEREAVNRIGELSQAASRQAEAHSETAETVRQLEARLTSDIEALSAALTRTRQTIIAVTLIATGGLLVLIPMIIALFG